MGTIFKNVKNVKESCRWLLKIFTGDFIYWAYAPCDALYQNLGYKDKVCDLRKFSL
jgi:hypothetical protein